YATRSIRPNCRLRESTNGRARCRMIWFDSVAAVYDRRTEQCATNSGADRAPLPIAIGVALPIIPRGMKFFGAGLLGMALFIQSVFAAAPVQGNDRDVLDPPRFEV